MNKSHHKLGILIRTGKIIFPDPVRHGIEMSDNLKDIIMRLLDRNPETRLGSSNTTSDKEEIMAHPFFMDVDWDALLKQTLPAPYIPEIRTDLDEPLSPDLDQNVQDNIKAQDDYEQLPDSQVEYIKKNQNQFDGF